VEGHPADVLKALLGDSALAVGFLAFAAGFGGFDDGERPLLGRCVTFLLRFDAARFGLLAQLLCNLSRDYGDGALALCDHQAAGESEHGDGCCC